MVQMISSKQIAKILADAVTANASMLTATRINELGGVKFEVHDSVSGEQFEVSIKRITRGR